MRNPPTPIISALIASYSQACSVVFGGDLPLHLALKHGASVPVIQTLLSANIKSLETKDCDGKLPLEIYHSNKEKWTADEDKSSLETLLKDGIHSILLEEEDYDKIVPKESDKVVTKEIVEEIDDHVHDISHESWMKESLCIVVIGASGDLAKKKTYPSLLHLYDDNLLPEDFIIWGYARSNMSHHDLREKLRPFLEKSNVSADVIDGFLGKCYYKSGNSYGDVEAYTNLNSEISAYESNVSNKSVNNRLFYFAIPPNVFAETGFAIKQSCVAKTGWTRLIVEKPFGRDLQSCDELLQSLSNNFEEEQIFRIDHYLGKEMVQNLLIMRFGNLWFDRLWDRNSIQCVILTFKEPFGTEGRGGYFDKFGIIRDIIQNHLLQVLTLLAMEPPTKIDGADAGESIRDAKVKVLQSIAPITIDEVLLGQYEGYTEDPTIENKDSNTPTFAAIRCFVHTPRWAGVPFIFKAGKAMNERKAEMRIQFKDAPASEFLFNSNCPRNELVMRMQPNEAIYMKSNVKSPGFATKLIQSELEVNYNTRYFKNTNVSSEINPDAYTRLILDVLRGRSATFVRSDELRRSWAIFTPLLHKIERENIKPIMYQRGTRGPPGADAFIERKSGYIRNEDYIFYDGDVVRKTAVEPAISPPVADIGVYGLAVMGQNFALNIASHGFSVCVGNRTLSKVDATLKRAFQEGRLPMVGASSPEDFIQKLKRPRKVIMLVMAGKPVDDTITTLTKYMEKGDILVDGGNEYYPNSIRRARALKEKGIYFIGMGISGGEEGARLGPSLMPGGAKEAYEELEPILTSCAAQTVDGESCCARVGPIGSGNFVKMVHNGIEYGDMQLIAEVYDILKNVVGLDNESMSTIFNDWNKGKLESYLIEITAEILAKEDDITGKGNVIDYILDKAGSKGTGKWTVQEAAEVSVAASVISGALDSRYISSRKDERVKASVILQGPEESDVLKISDSKAFIKDIELALYAAKIVSYAQGLSIIKTASDSKGWEIELASCVSLWKGGCIIRSALLKQIVNAFKKNSSLSNLMIDENIAKELNMCTQSWRNVVMTCATNGISCPALCSALNYFDSYRTAKLPANLTQAQRDFFGGHTYERVDQKGPHHTAWTDSHKDIGDITERSKGEK
jgi:6-phosphogluconate dehydrogenase (decarboxylating)/glucose-6-phosphate 1-dehydrogenase